MIWKIIMIFLHEMDVSSKPLQVTFPPRPGSRRASIASAIERSRPSRRFNMSLRAPLWRTSGWKKSCTTNLRDGLKAYKKWENYHLYFNWWFGFRWTIHSTSKMDIKWEKLEFQSKKSVDCVRKYCFFNGWIAIEPIKSRSWSQKIGFNHQMRI